MGSSGAAAGRDDRTVGPARQMVGPCPHRPPAVKAFGPRSNAFSLYAITNTTTTLTIQAWLKAVSRLNPPRSSQHHLRSKGTNRGWNRQHSSDRGRLFLWAGYAFRHALPEWHRPTLGSSHGHRNTRRWKFRQGPARHLRDVCAPA